MKKNPILFCLALLAMTAIGVTAQTETIDPGPFDGGRLRTNTAVDFHSFNQWISMQNNPGNVGLNPNGIWWSFLRFPTVSGEDSGMTTGELFDKISTADSVALDIAVNWYEVDPALVGVVEPGVTVSVYFVPGLAVPEGSLPTWTTTWIGNYPNAIKTGEIVPSEVEALRATADEFREGNPPTIEEIRAGQVRIDMTAAIAQAINDGTLDADTPWGIIFYTEEAEPLTPNDPKWADRRGTVLGLDEALLQITTASGNTWAGYPVDAEGFVDTGDWIGLINVSQGDWIFNFAIGGFIWMPADAVQANGAWGYILRQGQ